MCLYKPSGPKCECPTGMELLSDEKTCICKYLEEMTWANLLSLPGYTQRAKISQLAIFFLQKYGYQHKCHTLLAPLTPKMYLSTCHTFPKKLIARIC